jgi:hypothetical protein
MGLGAGGVGDGLLVYLMEKLIVVQFIYHITLEGASAARRGNLP